MQFPAAAEVPHLDDPDTLTYIHTTKIRHPTEGIFVQIGYSVRDNQMVYRPVPAEGAIVNAVNGIFYTIDGHFAWHSIILPSAYPAFFDQGSTTAFVYQIDIPIQFNFSTFHMLIFIC